MVFRPLPLLSFLTLVALALLVWLGLWQLSRMDEKADAIAAFEAASDVAPVSIEDALCGDTVLYGQRIARPDLPVDVELRFFGRDGADVAGWRLFSAVAVPDCAGADTGPALLVESGFVALDGSRTMLDGPLTLEAAPARGMFDADNDPASGTFHHYDATEMAAALGLPAVSDLMWLTARPSGLPPHLAQTPPSRHLGYALTWFGFAITLLGVYIAFHVTRGRLGFTRR
ncbi:SURF1 family protein [Hyphobacterium marinum]|uniref:SURF1-like protein n=1 Tax=Hyphobacterium marinum TaxID=3116574 RepID=A0ABU7LWT5_9PROT|nr:SURF1 family protein [Hyphobacterium sp. Y6023]MEE2566013.1 SURF1 family protein [Hyphobacterium sp. Y6023]